MEDRILIKRLVDTAIIPEIKTAGSAGFDLYLESVEVAYESSGTIFYTPEASVYPNNRILVHTGIAIAIPKGHVGLIFPRSGLATEYGLRLSNCVGVVDSDYRGEILVAMTRDKDATAKDGGIFLSYHTRVAQIVFIKHDEFPIEVVDELDETERGKGGFGSTGTK